MPWPKFLNCTLWKKLSYKYATFDGTSNFYLSSGGTVKIPPCIMWSRVSRIFSFFCTKIKPPKTCLFQSKCYGVEGDVANPIGPHPQELFRASHIKRGRIFSLKGVSADSSAVAVAPCVRLGTRCNLRQILDSEWNWSQQVIRFWDGFWTQFVRSGKPFCERAFV